MVRVVYRGDDKEKDFEQANSFMMEGGFNGYTYLYMESDVVVGREKTRVAAVLTNLIKSIEVIRCR